MAKHFFLFTIGPVQSFIGEARKTQDLYGGSLLLSWMMNRAVSILNNKLNGQIIFPDNQIKESLPNRVLAIISTDKIIDLVNEIEIKKSEFPQDVDAIKWFGNYLIKEIKNLWIEEGVNILEQTGKHTQQDLLKAWIRQLENHLELYWASYPGTDYQKGFVEVHRLLGAAKHSRSYSQWEEQGKKCNLDGVRNALVYRPFDEENEKYKKRAYLDTVSEPITNNLLSRGEGLSAISFTKRRFRYSSKNRFDSTTEIALLHCLEQLSDLNPDLKSKIDEIKGVNTQLYYEENTMEPMITKILEDERSSENKDRIRSCQQAIEKAAKDNKLLLSKYYSIVLFDGDNMGKWWNGDDELIDPAKLEEYHQKLSGALAKFSGEAKTILESKAGKRGRLVYAGGDDFLGFINLEHLMDVLGELRERFDQTINGAIAPYRNKGKRMTFSAGVQIAHYKEPLRLVVKAVRDAEKAAKKWRTQKDACCISILRASGEPSMVIVPFHTLEGPSVLSKISRFNALIARYFSSKTTDKIGFEFSRFPLKETQVQHEEALLWPKLWNALVRSCLLATSHPKYNAVLTETISLCKILAKSIQDWENMVMLFDTCDFLIRHTQLQFTQEKEQYATTPN